MTGNCKCNVKSWLVSTLIVGLVFYAIDYVVNTHFMMGVYQANSQYLRAPEVTATMKGWVTAYYFVFAAFLTCLYAAGYDAQKPKAPQGIRFGLFIGLFYWGTMLLGMYPYVPYSNDFYTKWFACGMVEAVVLGIVVALLHKPKSVA